MLIAEHILDYLFLPFIGTILAFFLRQATYSINFLSLFLEEAEQILKDHFVKNPEEQTNGALLCSKDFYFEKKKQKSYP